MLTSHLLGVVKGTDMVIQIITSPDKLHHLSQSFQIIVDFEGKAATYINMHTALTIKAVHILLI